MTPCTCGHCVICDRREEEARANREAEREQWARPMRHIHWSMLPPALRARLRQLRAERQKAS